MTARLEWDMKGNGIVSAVLFDDDRVLLTGNGANKKTVLQCMTDQAEHQDDGTLEKLNQAKAKR